MKAMHPFLRMLRDSELTDSGCWHYNGCWAGANKYGAVKAWGRMVPVHRLSARWFLGHKEGDKRHVLHSCDNPRCWNPNHLRLGTHRDNMRDKVLRHRSVSGRQKLTHDQVREIKAAIAAGERNMHIADRYGITRSMVSSIRHGRYWGWI